MEQMFFGGLEGLVRTLVVGTLGYVALIATLRWSGKRTLSKMSAFDLIVTVSLGSTLAALLLTKDVALAEGVFAFVLLIGLQFAVTWSSVRMPWVRRLVTGEPQMLFENGAFLVAALHRARVTEQDVRAAVRGAGLRDFSAVDAVVLETDGSFSVVERGDEAQASALVDVCR